MLLDKSSADSSTTLVTHDGHFAVTFFRNAFTDERAIIFAPIAAWMVTPFALLLNAVSAIMGSGWLLTVYHASLLADHSVLIFWLFGGLAALVIAFVFAELCASSTLGRHEYNQRIANNFLINPHIIISFRTIILIVAPILRRIKISR